MPRKKIVLEKSVVKSAIESTNSLAEAASKLGVSYQTFSRRAFEFELHESGKNQGLKGSSKQAELIEWFRTVAPWNEVLPRHRKARILKEQDNKCAICSIEPIWNGVALTFHLDHIKGRQHGDDRSNLRMICPNCHSQTSTFGSKNASVEGRKRMGWRKK